MVYEAKNFDHLLGTSGFSDKLLTTHFGLYQGYVKNVNLLMELLKSGKLEGPQFAEIIRRFGWEFNGMRLHELYFGNMSKNKTSADEKSKFLKQINADFGSFEKWETNFKAVGTMRGIGWDILAYDPLGNKMFNIWVNEHDAGHLADSVPLLIMDVFEHAFVMDYGMNRADYIKAFFNAIDWKTVVNRFDKCAF